MRRQSVVDGLITATPIMIGYLPIALAYGVLANQAGLSLFQLTSMSALVFGRGESVYGAEYDACASDVYRAGPRNIRA